MNETLTPTPSGRRAAATWVTATGVMLLLAAATLFVAVRWDQIPDGAKLAALGLVTIGALLVGRAMRASLPATGDVVFHLGALLIPVDLAAAAVRAGAHWPTLVLVEGVVSAVVFAVLARATGSVTLRIAAWASVPVAAAGVAACTPIPAVLVLSIVALGAFVASTARPMPRLRDSAVGWAALAATGPVLGAGAAVLAGADGFRIGLGTLTALGLAGHAFAVGALPAGLASAVVLGFEADRRRDLRFAFATLVAVVVGVGTALTGSHVGPGLGVVAVGGAFATIELFALASATDELWNRPLRWFASLTEAVALAPTALGALFVALTPLLADGPWALSHSYDPDFGFAAAFALGALGWWCADARRVRSGDRPLMESLRRGSGRPAFTFLVAVPLAAAVFSGVQSSRAVAATLVLVSAAALLTRRAGGRPFAALAVPFAVGCAAAAPIVAIPLAVAGSIALAWSVRRDDDVGPARLLGASASLTLLIGGAIAGWGVVDSTAALACATTGTIVALALLAVVLDEQRAGAGLGARLAAAVPLLVAVCSLGPAAMIAPVAVATALATADAVRRARPLLLVVPAFLVQLLVYDIAIAFGFSPAMAGLALCLVAGVWTAVAAIAPDGWRDGPMTAAALGVIVGVDLAALEPSALASAVMIVGLLVVSAGLLARRASVAHLGAAIATAGLFGHLGLAGVDASEWYLTPIGAQMLVAGWQLRRRDHVSSWVAYAPPIVFLGGVALVERIAGGPAEHALYCGGVGVVAVAVGGWRRLSGPLVVGTALLVAVSVHESLSSLAGIATWMWFAVGGLALVAVGVALERSDQGPVEAGRRLAEVLGERFG